MRIGFVSTYPPIECGIATYTQSLNNALRKLQNETFVMSQFGAEGEDVFALYRPESPTFAADVFSISIRMTPDVMHIQHEYGLYGSQKGVEIIELMLRYRLAGIPVVTTLHTVPAQLDQQEQIILKNLVDDSSALIVHEGFQRDTLEKHFGSGEKIHVIEHGVRELDPIADAKTKLEVIGKKVILLCGYFRRSKGFHKVLDCFPQICEQQANALLVMAGKNRSIEFADYQRELFTRLHESPVVDRILFLRGQFPQYTFDTIVSAADVVVLPYETGAQSGILCQCFALGRPVVVSNLPAFNAAIERSGGGLICERDEDYASCILRVLNDDALRQQLQSNIKRYVEQKAGWSHIARQHVSVYHSVVTAPYGKGRYVYFPEPGEQRDVC